MFINLIKNFKDQNLKRKWNQILLKQTILCKVKKNYIMKTYLALKKTNTFRLKLS
jgi:hypothetical protein